MPSSYRPPEIIDGKAVKSLVDAHAIRGAIILGQPGGFAVLVKYGTNERAIAAQRSRNMRIWRNLNTAAAYVRDELGVPRFEIDMVDHDPAALERKRPDTAKRQRQMHQAAEHDAWFRAEVQKTLEGIAGGTIGLLSEEEHQTRWQKKRAELLVRAGRTG